MRCFNNISVTPTGSIIPLHSFAFLSKTLYLQRFLFFSLVFLGIPLQKRELQKESQKGGLPPLKIYIFCKAFTDIIFRLSGYMSIYVHCCF